MFGEKIWESEIGAVFYRSKMSKPYYLPSTYNESGQGIVFAGYQALGSFSYPLIFCHHGFRRNDRERNSFYRMDVVDLIKKVTYYLPAEAAAEILNIFRSLWYRYPQKNMTLSHGIILR